MEKRSFTIYNRGRIVGVLTLPWRGAPLVVTCHGFYSTKDSEKYLLVEERFSEAGLGVLRFDFRGCGESNGRFEDTTLSGRLRDLETILDFVKPYTGRVGLLGSSFGGCVALIASAKREEVKATVTLSTSPHMEEVFEKVFEEGGYSWVEAFKGRRDFWEDLKNYNMEEIVGRVSHLLIIQGTLDELVPTSHAEELYNLARNPKKLEIIDGADHTFTDPKDREKAIDISLKWFKKYL